MFVFVKNMRISRKFSVAFGTICLLCLLQGIAALIGLYRIDSLTRDLTGHSLPAAQALTEMRGQMQTIRRVELASLLCTDTACEAKYPPMRATALDKYKDAKSKFESLVTDAAEKAQFQSEADFFNAYLVKSDAIMRAFSSGGDKDASALAGQEQNLLNDFNGALNAAVALTDNYTQKCDSDGGQVNAANTMLRLIVICVTVLVTFLCFSVGSILTRFIAPPLIAVTAALEKVAEKDLTVSVDDSGKDEIGRLSTALNVTVASIRGVLRAVAQSADTLTAAAEELSVRSTQTSSNAHIQTGKTDQIATAAQEMTSTIGEISQNAEAASTASRESAEVANKGGEVMQAAASTMQRIAGATGAVSGKMTSLAQRSEEIGKVINVIQEISEQTNLLALNAAIEAARAGEHGRGFAVVAGEVRRLAERTKSATEEIASTIGSIQVETRATRDVMSESRTTVEIGLDETQRARASLEAIIASSQKVEGMIQMIAAAATEQTAASSEISVSASHISQLAGENSQAATETAEACQSLSMLASELDGMIRQFNIDDDVQQAHKSPRKERAGAFPPARKAA